MRIVYCGVGRLQNKDPLDAAAQDYAQRLGRYTRFELKLVEANKRASQPDAVVCAQEATRLLAGVPDRAHHVALDEHGTQLRTDALAAVLQGWMNSGRDVVLFQGGATGLAPAVLQQCSLHWGLSALTLPHRLARVVALEALYRAFTLLRGEPYHRA